MVPRSKRTGRSTGTDSDKPLPDLPDWRFDVEEVSVSVYRVIGRDNVGRMVAESGEDVDELLLKARRRAAEIQASSPRSES